MESLLPCRMWQWEARVLQLLQYYSCWHHPADKTYDSLERLPLKLKNEGIILIKWQKSHSSVLQGLKLSFSFGHQVVTVRKILVVNLYPTISWSLTPTSTFIFFHAMFINVCSMLVCLLKDCLHICDWYITSSLVGCYSVFLSLTFFS